VCNFQREKNRLYPPKGKLLKKGDVPKDPTEFSLNNLWKEVKEDF